MTTSNLSLMPIGWTCQRQLQWPSAAIALERGAVVLRSGQHDGFREGHPLTAEHHHEIIPFVIALLAHRGPTAIALFVVTLLVWETIQCHSWWAWTHVSEKLLKAIAPFRSHHDAARLIEPIPAMRRILGASFLGPAPCLVLSGLLAVARLAMCPIRQRLCDCHFTTETAAAFCVLALQVVTGDGYYVPARAFARPCDSRVFLRSLSNDS